MFWLLAIGLTAAAVLLTAWPLLRRSSDMKVTGVALLLMIPVVVLLLYRGIGDPSALDYQVPAQAANEESFEDLTNNLRDKLEESPEHLEGWVLLGRSYKSMQQYSKAVEALETAARIDPDSPLVIAELVEARLFASGSQRLSPGMVSQLEAAVAKEPQLQKGLWLLGISAMQSGDDEAAIGYLERLLAALDPGSTVAGSVKEQLAQARQRMGATASPVPANPQTSPSVGDDPGAWAGLPVTVTYDGQPPPGSVLFVIARQGGATAGPPLAVRRISTPAFPLHTSLDDSHVMLEGAKLSQRDEVEITARLSMQGQPQAQPGDWQSASVTARPPQVDPADPIDLHLDSRVR